MPQLNCPLCQTSSSNTIVTSDERVYFQCPQCFLIFLDNKFFPDQKIEKSRYEEHNNSNENEGYINFLYQLVTPTLPFLQPGVKILDFGCGPAPTLSHILSKEGYNSQFYDPFFYDQPLKPPYQCIFASECFEHFFSPQHTITQLSTMLSTGGLLCVMTQLWSAQVTFENWYYRRDATHVCFYHDKTISYIASRFNFDLVYNDHNRVFIFQKK